MEDNMRKQLAEKPLILAYALHAGLDPEGLRRILKTRVDRILAGKKEKNPPALAADLAFNVAMNLILGNESAKDCMDDALCILLYALHYARGTTLEPDTARMLLLESLCLVWLDRMLCASGRGHLERRPRAWREFVPHMRRKLGFMPTALDISQAFRRWTPDIKTRLKPGLGRQLKKGVKRGLLPAPDEIGAILADMRGARTPDFGRLMYRKFHEKMLREQKPAMAD